MTRPADYAIRCERDGDPAGTRCPACGGAERMDRRGVPYCPACDREYRDWMRRESRRTRMRDVEVYGGEDL